MCGICGEYRFKTRGPVDPKRLRLANEALRHRGPDDEGLHADGAFAFAMRRLSIIDLESGRQPIANEDETVWTVFNGEIYNYVELRAELEAKGHRFRTRSDTETLVHLYEEYGEGFAERLNGMFAAALWDRRKGTLLLARDRAGIKPLYYAETPDGLCFASEIRPLLRLGAGTGIDGEGLAEYLGSGYTLSPRTLLQSVRKLLPGHLLVCGPRGLRARRFWRWPERRPPFRSRREALAELRSLFREVLERQLRADVPVGLFLSGGTDSCFVAAGLARLLKRPLTALAVGFEDSRFDELPAAREFARLLDLPLEEIRLGEEELLREVPAVLASLDDPLMDHSAVPAYVLSRAARRSFKVCLSGDGGDELFGGYPTYLLRAPAALFRLLPRAIREAGFAAARRLPAAQGYLSLDEKIKRFLFGAGRPPGEAHPRYKALLLEEPAGNPFAGFEEFYREAGELGLEGVERLQYVDFKTFLSEDALAKTDRMSMAHGLEVRVPLLDNAMIDFAARVPGAWHVRGWRLKAFLKEALEEHLPPRLVRAPKRGFSPPMARWINGPLKPLVDDLLSPRSLKRHGLCRPEDAAALLREHRLGMQDHSRALWALVVLESWLDRLRNPSPGA